MAAVWSLGDSQLRSREGQLDFLSLQTSRLALGHTPPRSHQVQRPPHPPPRRVNRSAHEIDNSLPPSDEIKKEWSCPSTLSFLTFTMWT